MKNDAYGQKNMPKCDIGIDCNMCKCRGMCSSYASYQYNRGYNDGINQLITEIRKQHILDENTICAICEAAENITKITEK